MVINQEYIAVYYVYNIHTYYVCTCMSKGKVTFLCKIIFDETPTFNHSLFHCDVNKESQVSSKCYLSLSFLDTTFCCLLICKMVEWISITKVSVWSTLFCRKRSLFTLKYVYVYYNHDNYNYDNRTHKNGEKNENE